MRSTLRKYLVPGAIVATVFAAWTATAAPIYILL
jgi:hypothetical protein